MAVGHPVRKMIIAGNPKLGESTVAVVHRDN
jgi:hypothetical protein